MKLFVSYASEYKTVAEEVALALTGAGHGVIFDHSSLKPGDDYNSKIRDAFDEIDAMIFLITPEAVQPGSYTLSELSFAQQRWPHPSQRVLPVMLAPTPLEMIPPYLKAVTFLQPQGHVAAEVASAIRGWDSSHSETARRKVRVTVHLACFESRPEVPAYFINVTNLFEDRDIEITHVWFEATPQLNVVRRERVLPVRLKPYESWETWQELHTLPEAIRFDAFTLARVRLSTRLVIESVENINVPYRGNVPGGPVSSFDEVTRPVGRTITRKIKTAELADIVKRDPQDA